MSILGNRVVRVEDKRLLTGHGGYVNNVDLPGCLYLSFVCSSMAHGEIRSIDVEEARQAPGVVGVYTAGDLSVPPMPSLLPAGVVPGFPGANEKWVRPPLATGRVRFVGEPIVAIVTEQRYQGPDAGELVDIDIEPLPAVVDMMEAASDSYVLFPEIGTNVMSEIWSPGDVDPLAGADVVIRQDILNQRISAAPLEPRTAAASFADGRLTFYGSTQGPSGLQGALSGFLGLAPEAVRVIAADVGGGFGAKGLVCHEELMVAALAIELGRPVRWIETRTESMQALPHGRAQTQTIEMGAKRDGTVVGVRLEVVQDCGAYPNVAALLPTFTWLMASGPYVIPQIAYHSRAVVTTTTPVGAFRGAGRPEATYALERAMDLLALELGMDPVEVRRRNLIPADQFPYKTAAGATYDSGNYVGALDRAVASANYAGLREEQQQRREKGDKIQLGIGVSTYVEITNPIAGPEPSKVRVELDGSATVFTGTGPHGQGHQTSWAMVASDRLGIPMDRITVIYGDTDIAPPAQGTGGSRSAQMAGTSVLKASEAVVEKAKHLAADLLEAAVEDVVLDTDTGRFHVAGTPTKDVVWEDVTRAAGAPVEEEAFFQAGPTYPFGSHIAVVEVDTETGAVRLQRLVACDDCGMILNPLLVEGQVHGGAAQGVAQALLEEIVFDETGNPLTSTFADYMIVSAAELPSFEVIEQETASPNNDLGAKGVGESGTIGSTPAVVSAVMDALSPYGIRHLDMPLAPLRVWTALQAAQN
jgi:carbon-monoxide dehydrogenase large subunit